MYDVRITMWLCQRVTWWLKAELNRIAAADRS